jgi:hypothetical protein
MISDLSTLQEWPAFLVILLCLSDSQVCDEDAESVMGRSLESEEGLKCIGEAAVAEEFSVWPTSCRGS